jgi:hypothetical protein
MPTPFLHRANDWSYANWAYSMAPMFVFYQSLPRAFLVKKFTLLTDQSLDKNGNIEVLFCSVFPLSNGRSTNFR